MSGPTNAPAGCHVSGGCLPAAETPAPPPSPHRTPRPPPLSRRAPILAERAGRLPLLGVHSPVPANWWDRSPLVICFSRLGEDTESAPFAWNAGNLFAQIKKKGRRPGRPCVWSRGTEQSLNPGQQGLARCVLAALAGRTSTALEVSCLAKRSAEFLATTRPSTNGCHLAECASVMVARPGRDTTVVESCRVTGL